MRGRIPKDLYLQTQQQRDMYERLYELIKDKDWTEYWQEQWRLGIISDLEADEDFEKLNKLLDMGLTDTGNLSSKVLHMYFTRRNPRYFEGQNYTEEDFWDINKG